MKHFLLIIALLSFSAFSATSWSPGQKVPANTVLAGDPAAGSAAVRARAMVDADLPTAAALLSRIQTWTAAQTFGFATFTTSATFNNGTLYINDSANNNTIQITTTTNESADRVCTIPALAGDHTFAFSTLAQTWSQNQTLAAGKGLLATDDTSSIGSAATPFGYSYSKWIEAGTGNALLLSALGHNQVQMFNAPNTADADAAVIITASGASKGLVVQSNGGAANLFEIQTETGLHLVEVGSNGAINTTQSVSTVTGFKTASDGYFGFTDTASGLGGGVDTFIKRTAAGTVGIFGDYGETTPGYLEDDALTSNIPRKNAANTFTVGQSIVGSADEIQLTVKGAAGQTASLQEWQTDTGTVRQKFYANGGIGAGGYLVGLGAGTIAVGYYDNAILLGRDQFIAWTDTNFDASATRDTGLIRVAAGEVASTDGATGNASFKTAGLRLGVVTKVFGDSPYTATATDHTILCDATGGAITVNLPAAASHTGRVYFIKKTDSSGNAITIDADGTETIDGALTQTISVQYNSLTIQSDGTNWFIH